MSVRAYSEEWVDGLEDRYWEAQRLIDELEEESDEMLVRIVALTVAVDEVLDEDDVVDSDFDEES